MKGLFINSQNSVCSIFESGKMCYEVLNSNKNFQLDYTEKSNIDFKYDFYIFNYHHVTNNWITKEFIDCNIRGKTLCIVTEVSNGGDVMPYTPKIFDYYILLDPTFDDTHNIFGLPRPLEIVNNLPPYIDHGYPIIGSFGFATDGKKWDLIVEGVQKEFNNALIKINIPHATYLPYNDKRILKIENECKQVIKKPGIKLSITHDYLTKQELIKWCSQNTLNCFFYHRNDIGLSAVTDQAISAKRPLLVNEGSTFRHILKYLLPYPKLRFKEAINSSGNMVYKMYDDWSPAKFNEKFNTILAKLT